MTTEDSIFNWETLVTLRSGREFKLILSDDDIAEIESVTRLRVFRIKPTLRQCEKIPWHRITPGVVLSPDKKVARKLQNGNVNPRRERPGPTWAVEAVGPIAYWSGPLDKPMQPVHYSR